MGHSTDFHDLMYVGGASEFSKRDINTVKLLYLLFPDITNTSLRNLSTERKIYAPIITGETLEQDQEIYTKAKTYINRSPDLSLGWTLLGTYYYKTHDYPKAIKALLKAKSLSRFDNERVEINGNLGLIYVTIKDYENAIFYFKEAQKYGESSELTAMLGFALIQSGKKEEGEQMMSKAFASEPSNLEIGFMLADDDCSEMAFIKTVKVLRTLKKNNADYIYSPDRRKYKILNLFVKADNKIHNIEYRQFLNAEDNINVMGYWGRC